MANRERLDDLWAMVRAVPAGRVVGYGALGAAVVPPVSGLVVGHWMASCPVDVPWWRVVGAKGNFPVFKRGPEFGVEQRKRLEAEGVVFDEEGLVERGHFVWPRDLE